jgi:hypothetical protein
MSLRLFRPLLVLAALQLSLAPAMAEPACPLPAEKRMSVVQLFFGRDIHGRGPLTDAEWTAFARKVLSQIFPDGFSTYDGDGQWLDPATGAIVRERTKIVVIATKDEGKLAERVNAVSDAYRRQFQQRSVGVITQNVCAAF